MRVGWITETIFLLGRLNHTEPKLSRSTLNVIRSSAEGESLHMPINIK